MTTPCTIRPAPRLRHATLNDQLAREDAAEDAQRLSPDDRTNVSVAPAVDPPVRRLAGPRQRNHPAPLVPSMRRAAHGDRGRGDPDGHDGLPGLR